MAPKGAINRWAGGSIYTHISMISHLQAGSCLGASALSAMRGCWHRATLKIQCTGIATSGIPRVSKAGHLHLQQQAMNAMLDPRKQCRGYIDRKINI